MLRPAGSKTDRTAVVFSVGVALLMALTGCASASAPNPGNDAKAKSTAAATPTSAATVYVPDGSAADNLPLFTSVVADVWSSDARVSGRAYIDALVEAGFDREAMQVTPDTTTVGNPVESLQFSVRWGADECLVGQVGPSTGAPVTVVLPQLAEGRCLVGATRPIDW